MTTWYAPRKKRCIVCDLPQSQWAEVNAAIWDGQARVAGHRVAGQRAYMAQAGVERLDIKVIDRHVEHIETTWHTTPPSSRERPVFPTDYESVTEKAAGLSAVAMERLKQRIESVESLIDTKDLIAAAKLGLAARQHQETLRAKDRRQATTLDALFGLAAGLVGALPPGEVIDVTPIEVLHEELAAERKLLEAHSRG
jgi:hypothetical protein